LNFSQSVVGKPARGVDFPTIRFEARRSIVGSYSFLISARKIQHIAVSPVGTRGHWIQPNRLAQGGESRLGAAHLDGKETVALQEECAARRQCTRTRQLIVCAPQFED